MHDYHIPVMLDETVSYMLTNKDGIYVDCTLGGGGHSEEILKRLSDKAKLYSIDQDDEALDYSKKRLGHDARINFCKGNFSQMSEITGCVANSVDGILMDLGVSSHQIDDVERGFSFQKDFPLDMRMDQNQELSAEMVVNDYDERQLKRIFFTYGEEKFASRIAKRILKVREAKSIRTTFELRDIVEESIPKGQKLTKSLARIFQALRIEVNDEMKVLELALDEAYNLLANNGRLVILSYHSLEDRIVKRFMRSKKKDFYNPDRPMEYTQSDMYFNILTGKPELASEEEINKNSRARSAKCRVAEKVIREVA